MTVPTRREAAHLLLALGPPAWLLRHSAAVADVAAFLAEQVRASGRPLDARLVEAGALLHDIDKALPDDHPHRALDHGHAGAAYLSELGHAELAPVIADHPVTRLLDDEHWRRWSAEASLEALLVAYADKRGLQDLVAMDERFADWRRRWPEDGGRLAITEARAGVLERRVCEAAGVRPAEVARLRWADDALAAGMAGDG